MTFPSEFRQGPQRRSAFLGDTDANAPETWISHFRPEAAGKLHIVLGLWERSGKQGHHELVGRLADHGLTVLDELRGHLLADNREPFGFRDGIGQPIVAGIEWCSDTLRRIPEHGEHPSPDRIVPVGEFVLGPPGEFGDLSHWRVPGLDLRPEDRVGYHGSFAALRVMRQDVAGFDAWKEQHGDKAAARLYGRTPNGAPLRPPEAHDGENFDFGDDLDGDFCPLDAHARRANPRGGHVVSRGMHRRRIIRRGTPYVEQTWDGGAPETGLIGVFVCANLAAQYEGVLGEWLHNGLHDPRITGTSDPLVGSRGVEAARPGGLPQFVYTRGVAYLFVPGIRGLRRLAGDRS
jgi:deferrochelatase/peroxidase EfeB